MSHLAEAVALYRARGYSGAGNLLNQIPTSIVGDGVISGAQYLSTEDGAYLWLPGTAGNGARAPAIVAYDITGDIEIRVDAAADWATETGSPILVSKWLATGDQRSWMVRFNAGNIQFLHSTDGTAAAIVTKTISQSFTDGQRVQYLLKLDVDDGGNNVCTVVYRTDGDLLAETGWSALGSDSNTGVTSIFAGTGDLTYGSDDAWVSFNFPGKLYRAAVYDGITYPAGSGTLVADVPFGDVSAYDATWDNVTDNIGATVAIGRSSSGYKSEVVTRPTFVFDGVDDKITVPNHSLLNIKEWTNINTEDDVTLWEQVGTPTLTDNGDGSYTVSDESAVSWDYARTTSLAYGSDGTKGFVFIVSEGTMPASGLQNLLLWDSTAAISRGTVSISAWVDGEPIYTVTGGGTDHGKLYLGDGKWAIMGAYNGVVAANINKFYAQPTNSTVALQGSINLWGVSLFDVAEPPLDGRIVAASATLEDDLTAIVVGRYYGSNPVSENWVSKKEGASATQPGWALRWSAGGGDLVDVSDGTDRVTAAFPTPTTFPGVIVALALNVDRGDDEVTAYYDGAPRIPRQSSTLIGEVSNALDMVIGADAGTPGSHGTFAFFALAVFKGVRTDAFVKAASLELVGDTPIAADAGGIGIQIGSAL